MIRVACVKWGRAFGPEYVNNLRRMVRRNTTVPHRFECLTDDPAGLDDGIVAREAIRGVIGKSNKIALFAPHFSLPGERIVFFDLDTLIVGDIDPLMNYSGRFAMLADFATERRMFMSGVMAWRGGFGAHIWNSWVRRGMPKNGGSDQEWVRSQCHNIDRLQEIQPGIVSFKYHKLQDGPRPGDRVVCFHNRPKNGDFPPDHWVSKIWNQKE